MQLPIADIFDRFVITSLKNDRLGINETFEKQLSEYKQALETAYEQLDPDQKSIANKYLDQLKDINKTIWDLEYEIRSGKEGGLGLEEIGRRALLIRNHNGHRAIVKNGICTLLKQDQYKDIKVDHIAEDLFDTTKNQRN